MTAGTSNLTTSPSTPCRSRTRPWPGTDVRSAGGTGRRLAIVIAVLLVLAMSNIRRGLRALGLATALVVLLGACASEAPDQAQVVTAAPTAVPTTPPLTVPTETPVPTATAIPEPTATPLPAPTAEPTPAVEPTPVPAATAEPATAESEPEPTAGPAEVAPTATPVPAPTEAPTPLPTPIPTATVEATEPDLTATGVDPVPATDTTPTAVVVVTSNEPPLECYDPVISIYRAFVDGVDSLSFEGGRVTCIGAATNGVSAARSYRHLSGLVISRNNNYIFNSAGTGYINFSGAVHFCINGQASSAPIQSETVPSLLNVIEAEIQRQVAQGATGPTSFSGSAQC